MGHRTFLCFLFKGSAHAVGSAPSRAPQRRLAWCCPWTRRCATQRARGRMAAWAACPWAAVAAEGAWPRQGHEAMKKSSVRQGAAIGHLRLLCVCAMAGMSTPSSDAGASARLCELAAVGSAAIQQRHRGCLLRTAVVLTTGDKHRLVLGVVRSLLQHRDAAMCCSRHGSVGLCG